MTDFYEGLPAPEYITKNNKVKCTYCGLPLKTRAKYMAHFRCRHLNEDGTWRPMDKNFRLNDPTPDELEAVDGEKPRKNFGPWWKL